MDTVKKTTGKAARVIASVFGTLVGLAGIEHGIFETLQGKIIPKERMINAIGDANKLWEGASERAITIIPNIYITGIIAMILGMIMVIWSIGFVQRKYGGIVLISLSIALFLFGGGMAPITMGLIAGIVAIRIGKPISWMRKYMGKRIHKLFAATWPWTFLVAVGLFLTTVEITIVGWFFGIHDAGVLTSLLWSLAYPMLLFILISVLSGLAYDSKE
jgi:membrane glycosyltransferase